MWYHFMYWKVDEKYLETFDTSRKRAVGIIQCAMFDTNQIIISVLYWDFDRNMDMSVTHMDVFNNHSLLWISEEQTKTYSQS